MTNASLGNRKVLAGLFALALIVVGYFVHLDLDGQDRDTRAARSNEGRVADGDPLSSGSLPSTADDTPAQGLDDTSAERTVAASPPAKAELPNPEMVLLSGTVRFEGLGKPVKGGSLSYEFQPPYPGPDVMTLEDWQQESFEFHVDVQADGSYGMNVGAGSRVLAVRIEPPDEVDGPRIGLADEYRLGGYLEAERAYADLVLDSDLTLDLFVKRGISIAGSVKDAGTGEALEDVLVAVHASSPFELPAARTDARGQFRITGIDPGDVPRGDPLTWKLTALHDDYLTRSWNFEATRESPSLADLDLTMTRGVVIAGRVVDSSGQGVEGVALRLLVDESSASQFSVTSGTLAHTNHRVASHVRSQAQGRFRFPPIAPATRGTLVAQPYRSRFVGTRLRDLDLSTNTTELLVQLESAVRVHVHVAYSDGTLPERDEWRAVIHDPERGWIDLYTFGSGYGEFPAFAGRTQEVFAFANRTEPAELAGRYLGTGVFRAGAASQDAQVVAIELQPDASDSRFAVPDGVYRSSMNTTEFFGHLLLVTVVDGESKIPLGGGRIQFECDKNTSGSGPLDSTGRFALELAPGHRHLRVSAQGFEPITLELELPPNAQSEVVLSLAPLE